MPGDRVVIRKYCIETTNNNVGLLATANSTRFRSTNRTGKQILCEEPLEFLGITQNIYGQEFDNDFSKNEIHICIILNTVECTQKQTYCFFHITWKSKTTVFLLLKLKRQKKPVPYYSNTSATQRLVLSGDIEENPGPIQDRKLLKHQPYKELKQRPNAQIALRLSSQIIRDSYVPFALVCTTQNASISRVMI